MSIWEHVYKLIDPDFSFEASNNTAEKTLNKTGFNSTHMNNTTRVGRMSLAPNKRIDKVQVIRNKMEILGYQYPIPAKTTFNTISQSTAWQQLLSLLIHTKNVASFQMDNVIGDDFDDEKENVYNLALERHLNCQNLEEFATEFKQHKMKEVNENQGTLEELNIKYENLLKEQKDLQREKELYKSQCEQFETDRLKAEAISRERDALRLKRDKLAKDLENHCNTKPSDKLKLQESKTKEARKLLENQGKSKTQMIKELEATNKQKSDFEFKINEIDVDIEDYEDQAENLRNRLKNLKNQNHSICDADCEQLEELELVLGETQKRETELLQMIKDLDVKNEKIQSDIAKSIDLEKIASQNFARIKTELDYYTQLADSKSKKQQQDVQKKLSELFEKEKKIRSSVDEVHSRQKEKEEELAKVDEHASEVYENYKQK